MLNSPTIEKLKTLKLTGMLKALEEQMSMPGISELDFFERFVLLVDREICGAGKPQTKNQAQTAKLRQSASIEDIDYRSPRGLTGALWPPWPPAAGSVQRM